MIFLPDGDDFVAESSGQAMLDEPVFVRFYQKGLDSVCLLNYPPFQHGRFLLLLFCFVFVTMTTVHLTTQKPQSVYYQQAKFHHNSFTNKHTMLPTDCVCVCV